MRKNKIRYRRVHARMTLLGLCMAETARMLGMSDSAFRKKMRGEAPFLLEEALRLHRILSMPESLEVAFERCDGNGIA